MNRQKKYTQGKVQAKTRSDFIPPQTNDYIKSQALQVKLI